MKKRLCTIFLVSALMLSGCGKNQELQENYDSLSEKYIELKNKYKDLERSYADLEEKYVKIQDLPDISVTLLDNRDDVIDLTLYSSIQQSQKEKKEYFVYSGYLIYHTTITIECNNEQKIDEVYLIKNEEIESITQDVENIDNTYVFDIEHGQRQIYSILVETNGRLFYTSIYPTNSIQ